MKKVLLVNPHGTKQDGFSNPPLGLLYIAGMLLRHGVDVQVVDGCLDGREGIVRALREYHPHWVGITCLTPGRKKAIEVARLAKEMDAEIKVMIGGAHPTIMYKQMLENYPCIDYLVLGEGEYSCLELVEGIDPSKIKGIAYRHAGEIIKTPPRKNEQNLDYIPFPAWHLLDVRRYGARGEGIFRGIDLAREPRISVIFSRGCTGHCDFCSTWWIWKGWRHRSAKNMADELQCLYQDHGVRHFCFADDAMTIDRQATIDLCDEIVKRQLKIAFHITTRTDCVDAGMLRKLKEAGCYQIAFGIETGSAALLDQMGKENDTETAAKAIGLCRQVGIRVTALLIVGNVGENDESLRETHRFLVRTQPDEIGTVGGLWILPGTKLYQQSRQKGLIDDDFWLGDEPYMTYTENYSIEQLARIQQEMSRYRPLHKRLVRKIRRLLGVVEPRS